MKRKGLKNAYRNLSLRGKLLLIILMAVGIPFLFISYFLYDRLPGMITAQTIREEQAATAKAAPVLSRQLRTITDLSQTLRNDPFYTELLQVRDAEGLKRLFNSENAPAFTAICNDAMEKGAVTAIRYYIDFPDTGAFAEGGTLFEPLSSVSGTYWNGIFASSHPASLFCPQFYLGKKESETLGDVAFITPVRMRSPSGNVIEAYQALYFSSSSLRNTLLAQLPQKESVAYITNERNAMIAATDVGRAGLYFMDYPSIRSNLMSSNGFLEKQVLGETVYVSYYYLDIAD